MAKQVNIENGVEAAANVLDRQRQNEYAHQWQLLRNKIDSLLLSTHTLKTDEVRRFTLQLDQMNHEDRRQFVSDHWGPICLESCEPLLVQLDALERRHAARNPA
jgi:hypothetical protein